MPVLAPVTTAAVGAGGGWGMGFPVRCQSIAARAFAPGPPAALARAGGAVLGAADIAATIAATIAAVIAATLAAAATAFVRDRLRAISRASFSAGGCRCSPAARAVAAPGGATPRAGFFARASMAARRYRPHRKHRIPAARRGAPKCLRDGRLHDERLRQPAGAAFPTSLPNALSAMVFYRSICSCFKSK